MPKTRSAGRRENPWNDANMILADNPIFVALDTPSLDAATALAAHVAPYVGGLKLGLEFVSANGPEGVRTMVKSGCRSSSM